MADEESEDQDDAVASDERERPDAHLADVADGCGCVEVWEHASAQRQRADD